MPLAGQYLLLVLFNMQVWILLLSRVTCYIEYFIVELFIEDTQYLSFYCARHILLSIPSILIQLLKLYWNFDIKDIVQVLRYPLCARKLDYKLQLINQSINQSQTMFTKHNRRCRSVYH